MSQHVVAEQGLGQPIRAATTAEVWHHQKSIRIAMIDNDFILS